MNMAISSHQSRRWLKLFNVSLCISFFIATTLISPSVSSADSSSGKAEFKAHLLLSFSNVEADQIPTWIALQDHEIRAPHEVVPERVMLHLPITSAVEVVSFRPGRWLLWHLNFTEKPLGDTRSRYLGRMIATFEADTVYYFGDIEFKGKNISYKPTADSILAACAKYPWLAEKKLILLFNGPEVQITNPCDF